MQDSSSRPASPCHAPSHTTLSADRDPNYLRKHKRAYVVCVCVCLCVCVPVCAAIASVFKFCAAASRLSACLPLPSLPLPYFILCKSAFACAQIFEVNACKTLKLVNFLSCIRNAANFCSLPASLPSPFPPLYVLLLLLSIACRLLLISASNLFVFCVCATVRIRAACCLLLAAACNITTTTTKQQHKNNNVDDTGTRLN